MPNSINGFSSRMERTEERINELQYRAKKITQTEKQKTDWKSKQTKPQASIVKQQKD